MLSNRSKKIIIGLVWLASVVFSVLYTFENPEKIEILKNYFIVNKNIPTEAKQEELLRYPGNSFVVEVSKKISISEKTAFIIHEENDKNFNKRKLEIYFQNGYLYKDSKLEKINLPDSFTILKNGGIKGVFVYKNIKFALVSLLEDDCFYASIISLDKGKKIFKGKCLPNKKIDFNGLGSSHVHLENKIFLSIGAPEQESFDIRELAQKNDSVYGKIVTINKNDLNQVIKGEKNKINLNIFTSGHRNPQGLTKIDKAFFAVEHGPKGGDELNKIFEGKNYGWPKASYGTQYLYDQDGKAYKINHENNGFEEPLFAFVPSIGISSLNTCPVKLKDYYNKPCLLALSLYGNYLRRGNSIIIYLLNEKMDKVHSVEKIYLGKDLKLRHFVTNKKNELYEDKNGSIYVSADKKGIYKLNFSRFRN